MTDDPVVSHDDLLSDATWTCVATPAGAAASPEQLAGALAWVPAVVPGTAARALLDAGVPDALRHDFDDDDWWFRCEFDAPASGDAGPTTLELGGLATLADVWLNGEHVLHSENMFVSHRVDVARLRPANVLVIRCAALNPVLARRRPRPRWRSPRLLRQNLRWYRTTLLGRVVGWPPTPAPVGPWRPVRLVPRSEATIRRERVLAVYDPAAGTGRVEVSVRLEGSEPTGRFAFEVGEVRADAEVTSYDGGLVLSATLDVDEVEPWWPRTHGPQPLYDVSLLIGDRRHLVRRVGFRTLEVDRADGAFTLVVNGVPIFARGANWSPPDPVNLAASPDVLRAHVDLMADAHFNLVRVSGPFVYESEQFLDLLDEHGLLLWQDAMFAFVDVPDDEAFTASVEVELTQVFEGLAGRPCVAVVCGGGDVEEQAQYLGVPLEELAAPMSARVIPSLVEALLPGTPYVRATPGESPMPTAVDRGVSHYHGVGGYLRPLSDVRAAAVRFAAECLPFATPPESMGPLLEAALMRGFGHLEPPRASSHRDPGSSYDFEDLRDHYLEDFFGVRATDLRRRDPERAVELARATVVHVFEHVLSEWRRPGSPCAGFLKFHLADLRHGQDLGLVDRLGRPKATWFASRRLLQPVAVLLTDEGLSGLGVHVVNDGPGELSGELVLDLYLDGESLLESASVPVRVPGRSATTVDVTQAFGSFRDLSYAYRFGAPAADVVAVSLRDLAGNTLSRAVHLPAGPDRPRQRDVGLTAALEPDAEGWAAVLTTREFAQWVCFDLPGWRPSDSWFHLLPGETVRVTLRPEAAGARPPRGYVRALNSVARSALVARP